MKQQNLRVGVLCSAPTLLAWQAICIQRLLELDGVSLSVILIRRATQARVDQQHRGLLARLSRRVTPMAVAALHKRINPLAPVSLDYFLRQSPVLELTDRNEPAGACRLCEEEVDRVRDWKLDVIVSLQEVDIGRQLHDTTRYGIWSFYFGDENQSRLEPPCFWEISEGKVMRASLQRLTEKPNEAAILLRGNFKTISHSLRKTQNLVLFSVAEWPAQICKELQHGNTIRVKTSPSEISVSQARSPTMANKLLCFERMTRNGIKKILEHFRDEKWAIGIINRPIHDLLDANTEISIQWLPESSKFYFYADPFCLQHGADLTILAEGFDYRTRKGFIAAIKSKDGRNYDSYETVVDMPFHLSYPYLLEYQGEIYCIPDTYQARSVQLLRADSFPDRWVREKVLIQDFPCIDSTIIQYGDYWWLFCGNYDDQPNAKLYVWYAPDLFGPWDPHPLNPVKFDVQSSRSAGTPFIHNGVLYRPSQDCSSTYGGAVCINRVLRLSPTDFEEEVFTRIEPEPAGPYPDGLHTICGGQNRTIVDGKRHFISPRKILVLVRRRVVAALSPSRVQCGIKLHFW